MKKRELMKVLKREQRLTRRALDIIIMMYEADTATDEAPTPLIPKPGVHEKIEIIKPGEFLRDYR